MMGVFGMGIWGMAPAYTAERFPTSARGVAPASVTTPARRSAALMSCLLGMLQDRGIPLTSAMTCRWSIAPYHSYRSRSRQRRARPYTPSAIACRGVVWAMDHRLLKLGSE
jgi:hypothetical protein